MQALVIEGFGGALQLKEVATPQVGPNDVLIQVNACGVGLTVVNLLATPGRVKPTQEFLDMKLQERFFK